MTPLREALPGSEQDREYAAFNAAVAAEEDLLKEIDGILANAPDRAAAERTILDQYSTRLEQASEASRSALHTWLSRIKTLEAESD